MADGEINDGVANEVVELEAMGKDDLSWHPCQVSLCHTGRGLIVRYEDKKLEETIADKKEIFTRIRIRSTPLQGDDCLSIRQGEHVLAAQTSHVNGFFYDARVEKAIHVRHSKRNCCRCSFTTKWLQHAHPQEAVTVPASAIMKLATKAIHLHPIISSFFSMPELPNALDARPCSTVVDGKNWDMDIEVLLEQQIKAITTSTDIPGDNILKDFVPRHKVDLQGQSHGYESEASLKDSLAQIPSLDELKGYNGSENQLPIKLILETPPAPTLSIQEELSGSRLLLNPLAARAALASLRSRFPQNPELSAWCDEKVDMTGKQSTSNLLQGSTFCSFSAVNHSSDAEDFSLEISATLEAKNPNLRSIVKKLFPTSSSPPCIVDISHRSSGAQLNGMEKEIDIGENKTKLSTEMRLTRLQIQRNNGMHETSQMTNNNATWLRLADTRRITRSRVGGAERAEAKEYNRAIRGHALLEFINLETFSQSTVGSQNYASDDQRAVASQITGQINARRFTRSRVKGSVKTGVNEYDAAVVDNVHDGCTKPGTCSQDIVDPEHCFSDKQKVVASRTDSDTSIQYAKDEKSIIRRGGKVNLIQNTAKCNNSKRLTRSAAREDSQNNNVQPKLKLRKSSMTESIVSTEGSGNQRSLTSSRATKTNEPFAHKESSVGGVPGTRKSTTSKKQETRFSPRLRFLPRTRSQNKA